MKILIVDALGAEDGARRFTRDVISAGPRTVAGILEKFSIESRIITAEQFLAETPEEFIADHLFVSAMTMDFPAVKLILDIWLKIPQRNPNNSIRILGGPITASRSKILLNLDFNIGVFGEAEGTLNDLITKKIFHKPLDFDILDGINGIMFQTPKGIVENPIRPYLSKQELNDFRPSTKHILDYPFYRAARIFVECVRGCSNFYRPKIQLPDGRMCNDCGTCTSSNLNRRIQCPLFIPPGCGYCSVPALYGPPRSRLLTEILREIKELIDLGALRLILGASDFLEYQREELVVPNPLTDPKFPFPNYLELEKLLAGIADLTAGTNVHIFIENIKASLFSERAASLISTYLPNTTLSIGCETGSKSHSKLLGRAISPFEVLQAVKLAQKYNLRVHTYFIHGLPGQTIQTAIETKRHMEKLANAGIEKITVYKFRPLPMSAFEEVSPPPFAPDDKASKIIVDSAIRINREKKQKYLNTVVQVIISEVSKGDKSNAIGYPLRGGPTILVNNAAHLINQIVDVRIDRVLSDKLLGGTVVPQ